MALEIIIILSLIQGITEFLPISSSAHLIIIPEFFLNVDSSRGFDVSLHFGSLLAVIYYLKKDLPKKRKYTATFLRYVVIPLRIVGGAPGCSAGRRRTPPVHLDASFRAGSPECPWPRIGVLTDIHPYGSQPR